MLEMLSYSFMQKALVSGMVIAILTSISGLFIVLKRYSMIGETLAHSALVGVAVGIVVGANPLWSAVLAAFMFAMLLEYIRTVFGLYSDAMLSIVLSASLAIAVIIVSIGGAFNNSLFSYLFGSILSVSGEDLITIVVVGGISVALLLAFSKELYFIAYDEDVARSSGIKVKTLNFLLIGVVAIVTALSMRIVGTLLVGALMVIPSMAALQFRAGFKQTLFWSLAISLFSVFVGMWLSFLFSLPSGATIVLVVLACFILSLLYNRQ